MLSMISFLVFSKFNLTTTGFSFFQSPIFQQFPRRFQEANFSMAFSKGGNNFVQLLNGNYCKQS